MTFLASNTIPADAYRDIKSAALRARQRATAWAAKFSAVSDFDNIWRARTELAEISDRLVTAAAVPGILPYAKDQESNQAYDIAAEYTALAALVDDARNWIDAALPADGSGYLLVIKRVGDTLEPRAFTAAQLAPLVVKLTAIVNAVS